MALDPLNKLCKWRAVLAGWHTGTRAMQLTDGRPTPGVQAMRDLMDKWLLVRVENSALASLLIKKGVFSAAEFTKSCYQEAALLDREMERLFPGFRTIDDGVQIYDLDMAKQTMADRGFPP